MQVNSSWEDGINSEFHFWKNWVLTRGAKWPDDYTFRIDPLSHFQFAHLLEDSINLMSAKILDVGAGPMTRLGKTYQGVPLNITAVDALAELYEGLPYEHGTPLIKTRYCKTEDLESCFPKDHFDAVFAFNTLDHSEDPLQCFRSMLSVAKSGGVVVTQHAANEASNEGWRGMHQWNFSIEDDTLYVTDKYGRATNILEHLREHVNLMHISDSENPICSLFLRKI